MDTRYERRRQPCLICAEPVDAESIPGRPREWRYWTPDSDFIHACPPLPRLVDERWWETQDSRGLLPPEVIVEAPVQVQPPAPKPLLVTEYGDEVL